MDKKGCAKMYKLMKGANTHILDNFVSTWDKNTVRSLTNHDLSISFNLHHGCYKDSYLKYIQFRTLHKRFYTNVKLFKMEIKNSALCSFCKIENDSVEHMLIECTISKELWRETRNSIDERVPDYLLTEDKIIMGELEKSICINSILLLTETVIYNAMKEGKHPYILAVKNETKNLYFQEKYRFCLKGQRHF